MPYSWKSTLTYISSFSTNSPCVISPTAVASRHITSRETTPKLPKFLSLCVSLYIYTSTRLPEFPQKYSEVSSKLLFPYPTHFLHNPTTTHAHHLFHLCFYLREQYRCPPRLQSLISFPSSSPQSQLVVRSQESHSPPPHPEATTSFSPPHPSRSGSANYYSLGPHPAHYLGL